MARRDSNPHRGHVTGNPVEADQSFLGCPVKWRDALTGETNWYKPPATIPLFRVGPVGHGPDWVEQNVDWPDQIRWQFIGYQGSIMCKPLPIARGGWQPSREPPPASNVSGGTIPPVLIFSATVTLAEPQEGPGIVSLTIAPRR